MRYFYYICPTMYFTGIIITVITFFIIGIFHPIVDFLSIRAHLCCVLDSGMQYYCVYNTGYSGSYSAVVDKRAF